MLNGMLPGGSAARIYLYASAVDMRRSFDGLHAIVQSEFDRDVRAGDLFVFLNKRRDRMKALWWDTDGLAIFMKRLERGTYQRPNHREGQHLLMDRTELGLLLSGIELASVRRRRRYISPQVATSTSTTEISNTVVS